MKINLLVLLKGESLVRATRLNFRRLRETEIVPRSPKNTNRLSIVVLVFFVFP